MTSESKRPLARMVPGGTRAPRGRLRRRLGAAVRLIAALTLVGGLYTAFNPGYSAAEDTPTLSEQAAEGKRLYDRTCISCHGTNAEGVEGRGPSLIGVGSAAVEFQVETGRMPAARQEAQIERKPPQLTPDEARKLGAYIQQLGGGPQMPPEGTDLRGGADIDNGGRLFRENCSSCHAFSTRGGALSSGKYAPSIAGSSDRHMYAAMLTGPQSMPVFADNQLTPEEKRDIIGYVQYINNEQDPGGFGLGRYGPVPEGLVVFLVGIVALVFATLWIAGKS
jgi:ubiquinol-cytochrome c reductase cytochrome c subunit